MGKSEVMCSSMHQYCSTHWMLIILYISFLKALFPLLRKRCIHHYHCNCCLWSKVSFLLLLLFNTLVYPYIKVLGFLQGTGTCISTYTSTLQYRIAGAGTSSHVEFYSPSTTSCTVQVLLHSARSGFFPAVQGKVHISTERQGVLIVFCCMLVFYSTKTLFSPCITLQTKISSQN
jgi:hypothetical protein